MIKAYKPVQNLCARSFLLKKGSKATNHLDNGGSPTYIVHNQFFNWHDEKGIEFTTDLYLAELAWQLSPEHCISSGGILHLHLYLR